MAVLYFDLESNIVLRQDRYKAALITAMNSPMVVATNPILAIPRSPEELKAYSKISCNKLEKILQSLESDWSKESAPKSSPKQRLRERFFTHSQDGHPKFNTDAFDPPTPSGISSLLGTAIGANAIGL